MIAGTGAEHHCFAPVLALFGLVKTAAKRRRGLGGSPTSSPVLRISRTLKNQPRQDAEADKDG